MRTRTALGGLLIVSFTAGCTHVFDFERARRMFDRPARPAPIALRESPPGSLPAPGGLHAVSGELRRVPLRWNPLLVPDVGGYVVERAASRDGAFERVAALAGRLSTTHIDACEAPGGPKTVVPTATAVQNADADAANTPPPRQDAITCFYRVRAFDTIGRLTAGASPVAAATTAPAPAPPDDVRAYSHQPRYVPLSWRASEDPTLVGYRVERSPTSRGPFGPIADLQGRHVTTHVDRNLGDLRVFYYRVRSVNSAGGEGPPSESILAVTKPEPLPPLGLRVAGTRLGEVKLAWEPNVETDVNGYRLLRSRAGDATASLVVSPTTQDVSASDTMVGAGETVSYTVIAVDRDGLESASTEPLVVVGEDYDLEAVARADGIHLSWDPRTDEGYVRAIVVRDGWFGDREVVASEPGRFVDGDISPGRRYRYRVVLERADGSRAPQSRPVEAEGFPKSTASLRFRVEPVESPG